MNQANTTYPFNASSRPIFAQWRLAASSLTLMFGYGLAAGVVSSCVTGIPGMVAAVLGAALGVGLVQYGRQTEVRTAALFSAGLLSIFTTWIVDAILVDWWLVPSIIGISASLVASIFLSYLLMACGVATICRTVSTTHRILAPLDAAAMLFAIGTRFAAHRHYQWGSPRFLSDWVGINRYDITLAFSILGLLALVVALISIARHHDWKHLLRSIASLVALLLLLLAIGGAWLRNPQVKIEPVAANSVSIPGSFDASNGDGDTGSSSGESSGPSGGGNADAGAGQSASGGQSNAKQSGGKSNRASQKDDPFPKASSQNNAPRPIAMVLLEDDIVPTESHWYFRETAVSQFNGRRLVVPTNGELNSDIPAQFSTEETLIGGIPLPEDMHEMAAYTVNLIAESPRPFGLPSMVSFAPQPNPNSDFFRQSYRATSRILHGPIIDDEEYSLQSELCWYPAGDPEWDETTWAHFTEAPEDPRYLDLAETIIKERLPENLLEGLEDSAMLKALAIKRYLDETTVYSLDPKNDQEDTNPADQLLFGNHHGYCVHIAHASVYLMRSLGLPARVGIGYAAPQERNGKSSAILIQSQDAHAWPEIYIEGFGWTIVDVNPEQLDPNTTLPAQPDAAVSDYLADKARGKSEHAEQMSETLKDGQRFGLPSLSQVLMLLLAAFASLYVYKAIILIAPRFVGPGQLVAATQRAVILRLAELGIVRKVGETRHEFGQRLHATYPELIDLATVYTQQQYGPSALLTREVCLGLQRSISQRIRQDVSLLRRALGALDPRVWQLVR